MVGVRRERVERRVVRVRRRDILCLFIYLFIIFGSVEGWMGQFIAFFVWILKV